MLYPYIRVVIPNYIIHAQRAKEDFLLFSKIVATTLKNFLSSPNCAIIYQVLSLWNMIQNEEVLTMQQLPGTQPVYYSVCLFPFDTAERFHGPLAQLLRTFFQTEKNARTSGEDTVSGQLSRYRGSVHKKRLKWVRKIGRFTVEETLPVEEGTALLFRTPEGQVAARVLFQENRWIKTSYFRPGSLRPFVILQPAQDGNYMIRLDWDGDNNCFRRTDLLACPYEPGTALQSAINARAGEPKVLASTDQGDFCYCVREEQTLRLHLAECPEECGSLSVLPAFLVKKQESSAPTEKKNPSICFVQDGPDGSYASNRELFQIDVEIPATRYLVAVRHANGVIQADGKRIGRQKPQEPPVEKPQTPAKRIIVSAEECCAYFGKLIDGMRSGHGRTAQENGVTAYEGKYSHDRRDGWGVCYYRSGEPCYAGGWKDDRRDGLGATFREEDHALHVGVWQNGVPGKIGSLFDKNGNLRFAGRIENGQKEGLGISYRAKDGSLFVGKWKNNQPTGEGAEFDAQGNLVYTGMWKDGKRHGRGTEFDTQGNVVFTGEWREDRYYDGMYYSRLKPQDM